jgi:hypothetical protein
MIGILFSTIVLVVLLLTDLNVSVPRCVMNVLPFTPMHGHGSHFFTFVRNRGSLAQQLSAPESNIILGLVVGVTDMISVVCDRLLPFAALRSRHWAHAVFSFLHDDSRWLCGAPCAYLSSFAVFELRVWGRSGFCWYWTSLAIN